MGLFDSFRQTSIGSLNEQQAILTIVLAAIKADGHVSGDEIQRLKGICILSPIFAANSGEQDAANIRLADTVTEQFGEQAVSKAAEALSPDLRETAFAFACDMVLADGILGGTEERFLNDLAARLCLQEDSAKAIVFATVVRNRGLG